MNPTQQAWMVLLLAIGLEVCGTTCMKLSAGFTKLVPSVLTAVFYVGSLGALTMTMKHINVSTTYAVWSGVGTAAIAIIGFVAFREQVSLAKVTCILLIIVGAVGLKLLSPGE